MIASFLLPGIPEWQVLRPPEACWFQSRFTTDPDFWNIPATESPNPQACCLMGPSRFSLHQTISDFLNTERVDIADLDEHLRFCILKSWAPGTAFLPLTNISKSTQNWRGCVSTRWISQHPGPSLSEDWPATIVAQFSESWHCVSTILPGNTYLVRWASLDHMLAPPTINS